MATPIPSKTPASSPTPAPRPAVAAPPRPTQAPKASTPLPKPASRLGQVRRGKLALPPRMIVYGQESVGKTTLAADAGALFADIEGGSGELDVARYPFNPGELDEFRPRAYDQIVEMADDLIANPGHGFPALCLDTADALEALIHAHLCKKHKVDSIERIGGGFGKGYRAAVEELRRFLAKLDMIRAQGVAIILVAHTRITTFKNPEGPDYDRFGLKVYDGKEASFAGQLKEWCEVVAFLRYESGAKKEEDEKRARGWSTNRRIVQLAHDAAWDAKWRLTVPMEMEFSLDPVAPWAPFADAITRARIASTSGPSITDQIMTELNRIAVDEFTTAAGTKTTRQAVIDMLSTATASGLARVLDGLTRTATPTITQSQES
jgi:hypothetical protein